MSKILSNIAYKSIKQSEWV